MATIVGLPKLSPTMEEGVLAKWTKKEGDRISPGDVIAEVETDKATMDFALEDEGVILKQLVGEGDTVKLGGPVLIIGEAGEDVTALTAQAKGGAPAAAAAPQAVAPAPAPAAPAPAPRAAAPAPTGGNGHGQAQRPVAPAPAATAPGKILASPLAKTLAAENGIDLRGVTGTGPGGRIVERDVQALIEGGAPAPAPRGAAPSYAQPVPVPEYAQPIPEYAAPPPPAPAAMVPARAPAPMAPVGYEGEDDFTDKSLSMMRKTIAKRLVEAKSTIPHFYLTAECDAGPLLAFRQSLNLVVGEDARVSVNDILIKAVALALKKIPQANASWQGDRIRYYGRVHVGVAVSVEDGLVTPVIRDADKKGFAQIRLEMRDLAERARAKRLRPEEMMGSTFSLSNLGMLGVDHFEAIINPPEAGILAVGRVRRVPVVNAEGNVVAGERMGLTMSCDHRVIDGALGARYLDALVQIIEKPAALAL